MTVYVDNAEIPFRGMLMSHLVADTLDELHEFAQGIGLRREWFQDKRLPHYDVSKSKAKEAIKAGAKFVPCMDSEWAEIMERIERSNG